MELNLAYADTTQKVVVPDRNLLGVLRPNDVKPFQDIRTELANAAIAAAEFLKDRGRVLVLVNDYTRPTPSSVVLEALENALKDKDVKYMVCLGAHREPTEEEFHYIFGPGFYGRYREQIIVHDCRDKSRLFFQGKTSFGTDVWFNRRLLWAERIIAINSLEPHYFAGYTGGRKGFLPGVAGYETIVQNHNNDSVTNPDSAALRLDNNSIHKDMTEAAKMVTNPVFSIQVVLDRFHKPVSVHYGNLFKSFETATKDACRIYGVPVEEKADIVLSVLRPPCDISFYHCQRAQEFGRLALKTAGVHITVSACRKGVGDDGFIRTFRNCKKPSEVLEFPMENRRLGWHKSARLARILETAELYTVMGVDDEPVRQAFMHPFHSIQDALDAAIEHIGPDARVYVIPDAGAVVPVATG